jgi:hypothetical protein
LNTALRCASRDKCKPFVPYIWLLMHALRACPAYAKNVVFRGVKADLSGQYPKGREVTWFQFSSCTCDLSVEQKPQFCGSSGVRTLFTIELTSGRARQISQYSLVPSEAEVLLPPNCRFKVKGVLNSGGGLVQIHLEELPCLEPIVDFDEPVNLVAGPQRQPIVERKPDNADVEMAAWSTAIIGAVLLTWKLFTSGITIDIWSLVGLLMFFCGVSFFLETDEKTRASDDHCGIWSIMSAFISGAMLLIWKFFTSGIAINDFWSILGVLLILSVWAISDHYDRKVPKRRKSS